MNILLAYATNSGTTMLTAQTICDNLTQKGHTVTMKEIRMTTPEDIQNAQAIILGTPSWDFDGKEGMPHEDYIPLMDKLKTVTYENKPFAVFGLGDSSYTYFCGAVGHLEEFVKNMKGKLITPSLRIDKFFSDQTSHMETITAWSETLNQAITT